MNNDITQARFVLTPFAEMLLDQMAKEAQYAYDNENDDKQPDNQLYNGEDYDNYSDEENFEICLGALESIVSELDEFIDEHVYDESNNKRCQDMLAKLHSAIICSATLEEVSY